MIIPNFVVFEGLDGSGTTTQLNLLKGKTENSKAWFTQEPSDNETGIFLRKVLKGQIKLEPDTIAYLFAADRCEHIYGKDGILSHANKGELVVSDRYIFSNLAYQGPICTKDLPQKLNKEFPLPALLFFFEIAPEKSLNRVLKRDNTNTEIYEKIDFQKKTNIEYHKIIEAYKQSNPEMKIVIIDAEKPIQEIHKIISYEIGKLPINNK